MWILRSNLDSSELAKLEALEKIPRREKEGRLSKLAPDGCLRHPELYVRLDMEPILACVLKFLAKNEDFVHLDSFLVSADCVYGPNNWIKRYYPIMMTQLISDYNSMV